MIPRDVQPRVDDGTCVSDPQLQLKVGYRMRVVRDVTGVDVVELRMARSVIVVVGLLYERVEKKQSGGCGAVWSKVEMLATFDVDGSINSRSDVVRFC
jgi:hypothetical protein